MTVSSDIEAATRRLIAALDGLEAAINRRIDADQAAAALAAQVHSLGRDRAALAQDLDQAVARSAALDRTNRDVMRRVDLAMENIRSVLDAHDGSDSVRAEPRAARS
jgi:ABC-type transporter Mla subunit MlaD